MPRPLIGVSTYFSDASWRVWKAEPAVLLPVQYPAMVRAAGGITAMLPPDAPELAAPLLDRLDALVISGGPDVDPARYGAAAGVHTDLPPTERDAWELALITAALERRLPLLCICRGMQLLNVHRGGTLIQHVPDVVGDNRHQPARGCFSDVVVTTEAGSAVAKFLGEQATVRCSHHQALDRLGGGLVVTARAADGLPEAVEFPEARFVVGVQWHPEEDADRRPFRALLDAVR